MIHEWIDNVHFTWLNLSIAKYLFHKELIKCTKQNNGPHSWIEILSSPQVNRTMLRWWATQRRAARTVEKVDPKVFLEWDAILIKTRSHCSPILTLFMFWHSLVYGVSIVFSVTVFGSCFSSACPLFLLLIYFHLNPQKNNNKIK